MSIDNVDVVRKLAMYVHEDVQLMTNILSEHYSCTTSAASVNCVPGAGVLHLS